ncbi:hypothetical protein HanIR_Chr16g0825401 [Helianthus annuus]|nr:hypothetical protein HanIR_Chr16g0825401 [Helianthus annuus]
MNVAKQVLFFFSYYSHFFYLLLPDITRFSLVYLGPLESALRFASHYICIYIDIVVFNFLLSIIIYITK